MHKRFKPKIRIADYKESESLFLGKDRDFYAKAKYIKISWFLRNFSMIFWMHDFLDN
jgi:hypothetical protein